MGGLSRSSAMVYWLPTIDQTVSQMCVDESSNEIVPHGTISLVDIIFLKHDLSFIYYIKKLYQNWSFLILYK